MQEVAKLIHDYPNSFKRRNLSNCAVIVHAQDFINFVFSQERHNYDLQMDLLSAYSRLNRVLDKFRLHFIKPVFVVDGNYSICVSIIFLPIGFFQEEVFIPLSSSKRTKPNILLTSATTLSICEFLSSSGYEYVVCQSDAVATCLALSSLLGYPILGSNPRFFLFSFSPNMCNLISPKPLDIPEFIPLKSLQMSIFEPSKENTSLPAFSYSPESSLISIVSPTLRPLIGLLMESSVTLPVSNMDCSSLVRLFSLMKWISNTHPLSILQTVMEAAIESPDPCLVSSLVLDYLISCTPDFSEGVNLLPLINIQTDKFNIPQPRELKVGSPFAFFQCAMDVLNGKLVCHRQKRHLSPSLHELFRRGKIDISFCAPNPPRSPGHILGMLQRFVVHNGSQASTDSPWSFIVNFFHFTPKYAVMDKFNALMLCCLLWHSEKVDEFTHTDHSVEQCPIVLSTVLCALFNMLYIKSGAAKAEAMFISLESLVRRELSNLGDMASDPEDTFSQQAQEVLQVYIEMISLFNLLNKSETPKMSLVKQFTLKPAYIVFPCLHLSALIASYVYHFQPNSRMEKMINSSFMIGLNKTGYDLSEIFHNFMDLIGSTKISYDESSLQSSNHSEKPTILDTKPVVQPTKSPMATLVAPLRASIQCLPNGTGNQHLTKDNSLPSLFKSSSRSSVNITKEPLSSRPGPRKNTNFGSSTTFDFNFDRPKTPPPANAFMKKKKGSQGLSGYAARLAQRYGGSAGL